MPEGVLYKYEIATKDGKLMALKVDPFASFASRLLEPPLSSTI